MTRLCAAVAALHSRHSHAVEQIRTVAVPLSILDASRPMGLFWVHEHPWAPVSLGIHSAGRVFYYWKTSSTPLIVEMESSGVG